jgi:hypothetical protein
MYGSIGFVEAMPMRILETTSEILLCPTQEISDHLWAVQQ